MVCQRDMRRLAAYLGNKVARFLVIRRVRLREREVLEMHSLSCVLIMGNVWSRSERCRREVNKASLLSDHVFLRAWMMKKSSAFIFFEPDKCQFLLTFMLWD